MPIHLFSSQSSRRAFLKQAALGSTAVALGGSTRAFQNTAPTGWLALVSDTHVAADPAERARGQVMADNLRTVVSEILAQPEPPAGVVIDGDLALKDGQPDDYATFLKLLSPVRTARVPLHLALGNHDDRAHFRTALHVEPLQGAAVTDKHVGAFEALGHRWLILDSLVKPNSTPGRLGEAQREWVGKALDAHPETPAIVFVHHNLASDNKNALTDAEELLAVLRPRRQAKAVIFGHTHVWSTSVQDGIHLVNIPAVGYPFAPTQPIGWCKLRPTPDGVELELCAIGGDRTRHGQRVALAWRTA